MHVLTQLPRPAEALEVYKQIQNLPKKNILLDQSQPGLQQHMNQNRYIRFLKKIYRQLS